MGIRITLTSAGFLFRRFFGGGFPLYSADHLFMQAVRLRIDSNLFLFFQAVPKFLPVEQEGVESGGAKKKGKLLLGHEHLSDIFLDFS